MLKHLRRIASVEKLFKKAGFFVASILLFYFLVHSVIPEKKDIIDISAFHFFSTFISPAHTRMAIMITFFGTGSFLIPSYMLIAFYLLSKKCVKYAIMVSVMAISGLLLGWLLKEMFHRSRPLNPLIGGAGGYSFPSGHALGGFIFSGVLLCLVRRTKMNICLKWILSLSIVTFGIMIGLSRIYLHVHYTTDVIGSLFVTFIWFSLFYIFFRAANHSPLPTVNSFNILSNS